MEESIEFRLRLIDETTKEMKKARKYTESSLKSMSAEQKKYRKAIESTENEVAKLTKEFVTASKSRQKEIRAEIVLLNRYKTTLNKSAREELKGSVKKGSGGGVGVGMGTIAGGNILAAGGIELISLLKETAVEMVKVTAEFEKYKVVLTNTLGSQVEAAKSMILIREIASETPFEVDNLTASYVKLVNRGFKPTREEIISLGDLASSTGKDFDQLAEALLDAQTMEFERLKEFGIKASKSGDNVAFTFKGITTEVAATDEAIQKYILSLGKLEGVSGSMAVISGTLGGKLSNLNDSWTSMLVRLGGESTGVIGSFVTAASKMLDLVGTSDNMVDILQDEQFELFKLKGRLDETTEGSKDWKAAVQDLMDIYPEYFENLSLEQVTAEDVAKAYQQINKQLDTKIKLEQKSKALTPLEEERDAIKAIIVENQQALKLIERINAAKAAGKDVTNLEAGFERAFGFKVDRFTTAEFGKENAQLSQELNALNRAIEQTSDLFGNLDIAVPNVVSAPGGKTTTSGRPPSSKAVPRTVSNTKIKEGTEVSRDRTVKQININVDKLVGVEQLETVNMKESTTQIGELVKRVLINAITDASTHNQFN